MSLLETLKSLSDTSHSEEVLIEFIIKSPERFLLMRPKAIATDLFVSVPTLYRFLEKLGYNGLTEFKIDLASAFHRPEKNEIIDVNYPISASDTYRELTDNLSELYTQTLQETNTLMDHNELMKACKIIESGSSITVFTTSSNITFAENFAFQMLEIGYQVTVPKDEFTQSIAAANLNPSDTAIIISYAGRSESLHKIRNLLNQNKVQTILVTSTQDNPLAKFTNINLYLVSTENHYNKISSFSSRFSLLYLLDSLYSGIFSLNYDRNLKFKKSNYAKINQKLK